MNFRQRNAGRTSLWMLLAGDLGGGQGVQAQVWASEDAKQPQRDSADQFGTFGAADRIAFAACLSLCWAGKVAAF